MHTAQRVVVSVAGGVAGFLTSANKAHLQSLTHHPLHKSLVPTPLLCQIIPSCSTPRCALLLLLGFFVFPPAFPPWIIRPASTLPPQPACSVFWC
ncbi:unnamed protein product [Pleuronectes platessa]|uniref:Uncharacterized protein n=1 Tax=Pleuronectes platessa TaxID=8262 RepID=A0A9N7UTV1_PLEPL|nr:unnamed protein product [Pleuronectes platessa]